VHSNTARHGCHCHPEGENGYNQIGLISAFAEDTVRHSYRTIGLAVVAVVLLTGCSTANYFRLLLTVKDANTGEPVEGIIAVLDAPSSEQHKNEPDFGHLIPPSTNADGQLTYEFMVSPYPSDRPWYLKVRKEGYEPVVIDIMPNPQPERKGNEKSPLPVTVEMKPLAKKP